MVEHCAESRPPHIMFRSLFLSVQSGSAITAYPFHAAIWDPRGLSTHLDRLHPDRGVLISHRVCADLRYPSLIDTKSHNFLVVGGIEVEMKLVIFVCDGNRQDKSP